MERAIAGMKALFPEEPGGNFKSGIRKYGERELITGVVIGARKQITFPGTARSILPVLFCLHSSWLKGLLSGQCDRISWYARSERDRTQSGTTLSLQNGHLHRKNCVIEEPDIPKPVP